MKIKLLTLAKIWDRAYADTFVLKTIHTKLFEGYFHDLQIDIWCIYESGCFPKVKRCKGIIKIYVEQNISLIHGGRN